MKKRNFVRTFLYCSLADDTYDAFLFETWKQLC